MPNIINVILQDRCKDFIVDLPRAACEEYSRMVGDGSGIGGSSEISPDDGPAKNFKENCYGSTTSLN